MFAGIAAFVSYNFGGIAVGIPLAILITTLAAVNRNIFDAASNAFLDVEEKDGAAQLAKKTAVTAAKRVGYEVFDYGLAGLSIALVVTIKQIDFAYFDNFSQTWFGYHLPPMIMGFDIRFIAAMISMWLVVDLSTVLFSIALYERTGHDITLGRSYRRMANVIYAHSRKAGVVVFLYEIIIASFWSGPDYTVLFFRDELKTRTQLIAAATAITTVHAILWTTVYWYGFDNIMELVRLVW